MKKSIFFTVAALCILCQGVFAAPRISERLGIKHASWRGRLRQGISLIPGGSRFCDLVGLKGKLESKVDHIGNRQDTSITELQKIAKRTIDSKRKIEEMYYFKKRSQDQAAALSSMLKRSKGRKFLGVILEEYLGIPVNPADYIPNIPQTAKLRKNLNTDLSLERDILRQSNFLLSDSRAALSEQN